MIYRFYTILLLNLLFSLASFAQGPKQIAKINRALWPYPVNTSEGFDYASKMEMLVFIEVLDEYDKIVLEDSLKKTLGLSTISMSSIDGWKSKIKNLLVENFKNIKTTFPSDKITIQVPVTYSKMKEVSVRLSQHLPNELINWYPATKDFYRSYIYEQLRLAALFPKTTSEISTLDASEITGLEYKDKEFLLTFDDGPSSLNGSTDKLIQTLKQNNVKALFFVLGDVFNSRLKSSSAKHLQQLYGNNVVGSHGKIHKSHAKYDAWKQSIDYTQHLIDSVLPNNNQPKYFRPPYGQRNQLVVAYLKANDTRVMLWNIDSQDWNAKISSKEVSDRMITLMLLWRRGILLFHDIHPKANEALPAIWKAFKGSGLNWVDPAK